MRHLFVVLVLMLLALPAFPKGKLLVEPYHNFAEQRDGVKPGLAIYESWGPLFWNSYSGANFETVDSSFHLGSLTFKNGIGGHAGKMEGEFGLEFKKEATCRNCGLGDWEKVLYVKFGLQLW